MITGRQLLKDEIAQLVALRDQEPNDTPLRWWINGAICALAALVERNADGGDPDPPSTLVPLFRRWYRPGRGDYAGEQAARAGAEATDGGSGQRINTAAHPVRNEGERDAK